MTKPQAEEIRQMIALSLVPQVGPITSRMLLEELKTAGAVLRADSGLLEELAKSKGLAIHMQHRKGEIYRKAEEEMRFMEKHRIRTILYSEDEFPYRLNECNDGPLLLYARGEHYLNSPHQLSVVGTRRASAYGRDLCRKLILGLAEQVPDAVIVSGLAYGIDVIAHRTALEAGLATVAVVAHGLHTLYPASHRETARKIMHQGCLLSDFDSSMGPERNNFLRRNRIIAGIPECTLVVESSERGGALTTASMAVGYHRNVLAVPGRATDSRSVGCNNLIKRDMAGLICSPEDLVKSLGWETEGSQAGKKKNDPALSAIQEAIREVLRDHPGIDPGSLGMRLGIPIQEVLAELVELEIRGLAASENGNRYSIRS